MALVDLQYLKTCGAFPSLANVPAIVLNALRSSAEKAIEARTPSWAFNQNVFTEYLDGKDEDCIVVNHRPIVEITSIRRRDQGVWSTITSTRYESTDGSEKTAGIIRLVPNSGETCFPNGAGNVEVIYNGGYSAVPDDVQLATGYLVVHLYKRATGTVDYSVRREKIGTYEVDRGDSRGIVDDWPMIVRDLLQPWSTGMLI